MKLPRFTLRRLFVLLTLVCIGLAAWVACRVTDFRIRVMGVDGITIWAVLDPPIVVAFQGVPNDGTTLYQGLEPVAGFTFFRRAVSEVYEYSEYRWGELRVVFNNDYRLAVRQRGKLLTVCGVDYSLPRNRPLVLIVQPDQSVREAEGEERDALLNKTLYRPDLRSGVPK
jgi:hypothetical protein